MKNGKSVRQSGKNITNGNNDNNLPELGKTEAKLIFAKVAKTKGLSSGKQQ